MDFGCGEHLQTLSGIKSRITKGIGYDILFRGLPPQTSPMGFKIYGSISEINIKVDTIISLACFEHIEPEKLPDILKELVSVSHNDTIIVGTVPRPPAKPILEFLSYKLRLIDPSQIKDHKVYYSEKTLRAVLNNSGWILSEYKTFQFYMNSFFILSRSNSYEVS